MTDDVTNVTDDVTNVTDNVTDVTDNVTDNETDDVTDHATNHVIDHVTNHVIDHVTNHVTGHALSPGTRRDAAQHTLARRPGAPRPPRQLSWQPSESAHHPSRRIEPARLRRPSGRLCGAGRRACRLELCRAV